MFVDDGRTDRSKESFQGVTFEKLFQSGRPPISFFRSDFRKARFEDCVFHKNNFSRCDFIASIFKSSKFIECNFLTSSIMYSALDKCEFDNNQNFNPDLFQCRLTNCTFRNQYVARATWRETAFFNCSFINCLIEMSTLQKIEFVNCNLEGADLSQMSATDIHFGNSTLAGATIDPDYLGTYTFDNVDLTSMRFAYRSSSLDFSTKVGEDFIALANHFEKQQRWSEAFNVLALLLQLRKQDNCTLVLEQEWQRCLLSALDLEIPSDSAENIRRLFRLAKHYLQLGLLSVSGGFRLITGVELINGLPSNSLIREELAAGSASFLRAILALPNIEGALAADTHSAMVVRFQVQVDTDDELGAEERFRALLNNTAGTHGIPFEIIKVGFGSVVIEAATWFVIVIMLSRAARCVSYTWAEIRLVFKAHDRLAQIMDKNPNPKEILNTVKSLRQISPRNSSATDLVVNEIEEIGRSVRAIMHEIKLGGIEFLQLVREIRIFIGDFHKNS